MELGVHCIPSNAIVQLVVPNGRAWHNT